MPTKDKATTQPITDLTAEDFSTIRSAVRNSMLKRGVPLEEVNNLMRAYRTMQPVFSAMTEHYKSRTDASKNRANERVSKACEFILGTYSNVTPDLDI